MARHPHARALLLDYLDAELRPENRGLVATVVHSVGPPPPPEGDEAAEPTQYEVTVEIVRAQVGTSRR